ncbi:MULTISPECIES: HNH endonuclease [Streptomyces]|uniref:HNH endonuclease n=1 Tax=Streptomyces TaxID=1883 RepID=UPI00069C0132|nr:HNH endonuclease signature motif containing protein [Streptomyces sp. SID7805]MYU54100.1 HNH endonuclease [Streptomyces sp. SID7805]
MRCIDCPDPATHRGRCKSHYDAFEGRAGVRTRRVRGRRRARRYDAAERLCQRLRAWGHGWCDWCLKDFSVALLEVDHVRPLSFGGEDIDSNVQVLCRGCHRLKTGTEFGAARTA